MTVAALKLPNLCRRSRDFDIFIYNNQVTTKKQKWEAGYSLGQLKAVQIFCLSLFTSMTAWMWDKTRNLKMKFAFPSSRMFKL